MNRILERVKSSSKQNKIDFITKNHVGRIVSYTYDIKDMSFDPVRIFNQFSLKNEDRVFWGQPKDNFYIVGVGEVKKLLADQDRFANTERQWEELLEEAIVMNPSDMPGTGLTAIGGMSFDPLDEISKKWRSYGHSQMIVPEIMFTFSEEKIYLTINILIEKKHVNNHLNDLLISRIDFLEKVPIEKNALQVIDKTEQSVSGWKESVQRAIDEIKSSRAHKIVMARELRVTLKHSANISELLIGLIETQPYSFVFGIERGDHCFVGATPERLVRVEQTDLLSTCLAGTAPRGKTVEEDRAIENALLKDDKNLEEHAHVVQMIRESITPYCTNVNIPKEPTVRTLKDLQHLYTPVTATLKENHTIFDIVESLHPTPALGGVPRKETLEFIRNNEFFNRGWFGAPVGWVDHQENGEFAVAIRSGLVQDNVVSLFAGCGVMRDSVIEEEYEETGIKFLPMLNVLEGNYDTN